VGRRIPLLRNQLLVDPGNRPKQAEEEAIACKTLPMCICEIGFRVV